MLQCHFEHVIGFIRRSTNDFLRNLRSHVVVGMFRSDVFDGAGRRHPVEWLVRTKFGENQQTVIGFDKQEIIDISERIGTYETSIQPFEDCCTIFVAKHPVTKPNLNIIKQHEHNLDEVIEQLMKTAIETTEKIIVK